MSIRGNGVGSKPEFLYIFAGPPAVVAGPARKETPPEPMHNELVRALRIVRAIIGALLLAVVAAAAVLPRETMLRAAPVCLSRASGGGACALCGMTGAFASIARGDLRAAHEQNRAGLPLFALFAATGCAVLLGETLRALRRRRTSSSLTLRHSTGEPPCR